MTKQRTFRATKDLLTRGDYGAKIHRGHNTEDDPNGIYCFDPDFGDQFIMTIKAGLESGDFEETTEA